MREVVTMKKIHQAIIRPLNDLDLLSQREIEGVMNTESYTYEIFRQCALAVLNIDSKEDNAEVILQTYQDFNIRIIPESRGIKLEVNNAPASAFVDGKMIRGIQEHLFSVLRDIVFIQLKIDQGGRFDFSSNGGITDGVFRILRNAGVVQANIKPQLVVCWGGHSIPRHEYDYSKYVGYQLGLRDLAIATGCGIGAMKGPMKGAVVGHGKQQINNGRYIGITEPGIIASEPPNPTVNQLVILPDIEKRLEAFVRLAHAIIIFPGGAGTAEEILYLLGLLMHPANKGIRIPMIFAACEKSREYFNSMDRFIRFTLGEKASQYYEIIINQPELVAQKVQSGIEKVHNYRRKNKESYAFNWKLVIPDDFQKPFDPSHENMRELNLNRNQEKYQLAAELRRAFSGIVSGNVKASGIKQIKEHGPYILQGDPELTKALDELLISFVQQGRMKLKGNYKPCFKLVSEKTD